MFRLDTEDFGAVGALAAVGLASLGHGFPVPVVVANLAIVDASNALACGDREPLPSTTLTAAVARALSSGLQGGTLARAITMIATAREHTGEHTDELSCAFIDTTIAMLRGVAAVATGFDSRTIKVMLASAPPAPTLQGALESLFASVDLPAGVTLSAPPVRPATPALPAKPAKRPPFLAEVLGPQRVAKVALPAGYRYGDHSVAESIANEPVADEPMSQSPDGPFRNTLTVAPVADAPVWPSFGDAVATPAPVAAVASAPVRKAAKGGAGYRSSRRASPAPRRLQANYPGWCSCDCGKAIEPGQWIVNTGRGRNAHEACVAVDAAE